MRNPSRSLSKGREAFSGLSLKAVLRAWSRQKPPMENSVMQASAPPATTASQRPERMRSRAWPIASVLEVQAVTAV